MTRHTWISLGMVGVALLLCGAGCGGKSVPGDSQQDHPLDKDDPRGAGGASNPDDTKDSDSGVGEDPIPDDDTPSPPVSCAGKACGESCESAASSACPPGVNCLVLPPGGFCDSEGKCSPFPPKCDADPPVSSCEGKACGETCDAPCPPGLACPAVVSFCDAEGKCSPVEPVCEKLAVCPEGCPPPPPICMLCDWNMCASAIHSCNPDGSCGGIEWVCPSELPICMVDSQCPAVGAPCKECQDGGSTCPVSRCVEGQCAVKYNECARYQPCAGKKDGEACSLCSPTDSSCQETAVAKHCWGGACREIDAVGAAPGQ